MQRLNPSIGGHLPHYSHQEITPETIDKIAIIKWLLVVFAYCWWVVVVVYFGLFAESSTLPYQVLSTPVIVASLALSRLFQMAMSRESYGFALLFFSGLLVAGMLA